MKFHQLFVAKRQFQPGVKFPKLREAKLRLIEVPLVSVIIRAAIASDVVRILIIHHNLLWFIHAFVAADWRGGRLSFFLRFFLVCNLVSRETGAGLI